MEAMQVQNLFAGSIRNQLLDANLDYDKLYEIRLRVGRPLFLTNTSGLYQCPGRAQSRGDGKSNFGWWKNTRYEIYFLYQCAPCS